MTQVQNLPFEFREPPEVNRAAPTPVRAQLDVLKDFPGRWVVISSYDANSTAHSLARRIKMGAYGWGFDSKAVKDKGTGLTEVYVIYQPDVPSVAPGGIGP